MKSIQQFSNKSFISIVVILMFFYGNDRGQSTANYAYATNTLGSLTNMSSGTTDLLAAGVLRQNAVSPVTKIGFTFYYMSVAYPQFSISSKGQMRLGPVAVSAINYTTPRVDETVFAPMSGFNSIQASGKVHYIVTGTAPDWVLSLNSL